MGRALQSTPVDGAALPAATLRCSGEPGCRLVSRTLSPRPSVDVDGGVELLVAVPRRARDSTMGAVASPRSSTYAGETNRRACGAGDTASLRFQHESHC